jgi:EpsD family peptidyl-prolyl cis-trans isomerase
MNTSLFLPPRAMSYSAYALAAAAVLLAAGCSKEGAAAKSPTQVAATVNKEEISVHQINFVLQRQQGLKPEQIEPAGRQVLERLIDQEAVLQKAAEQKLEREPRVLQEIETARRDILARAYLNKVSEAAPRPSAEEIKAYYDSKPALFAKRRIYSLQELAVQADPAQLAELKATITQAKSIQEVTQYLQAKKLPVQVSQNTTAAEALPLQLLDRFAGLKDGQTMFTQTPNGAVIATLLQSRDAPLTEEQARPAIEQYLLNESKRKTVEQEVKSVRAAAKVQYMGQFAAKPADVASAPAAAASQAPAPAATTAQTEPAPAAPAAPAAGASGIDADAMAKGLRGL